MKDYEIILSDQSGSNEIKKFCLDNGIRYVHSPADNAPDNLNFGISFAKFDYIKPMFIDDYFNKINALEQILSMHIDNGFNFVACSTLHYDESENEFKHINKPFWQDGIVVGVNTIGCPSVISFKKNNNASFDNNLKFLFDTDFYFQLMMQYNNIGLITDDLVITTINNNGAHNQFVQSEDYYKKNKLEQEYCLQKYGDKNENK